MKIITLSDNTVINDKLYRKGEVVPVDDGFNTNVKTVVSDPKTQQAMMSANMQAVKPIEVKPKEKDVAK
jgi:hypothetical protein